MPTERRLAAIMFTDIVGYTALMAESEEEGLRPRERHRTLVRPLVERYHGESIESPGDQSLSTFSSAPATVARASDRWNSARPETPSANWTIGKAAVAGPTRLYKTAVV